MAKILVGLGSGRCGTRSLAALFAAQEDVDAQHERKPVVPWAEDNLASFHLSRAQESVDRFFMDVAFYYLPHVRYLASLFQDIKFICLKRDKQATVESFCRKQSTCVQWFTTEEHWGACFPNYRRDKLPNLVSRYWDDYYSEAEKLQSKSFQIFPTEALNTAEGRGEILTFAGIENPQVDGDFSITD